MSHWTPRCIRCLEFGPHRHFGITITSFPPVAMDGLGLQLPSDIKPLDKLSGDVKCSHSLASFCGFTNPMLWLKELRQFPLATITACDLYCQLLTECPQLMATADIAPSLSSGQPRHRDTHTTPIRPSWRLPNMRDYRAGPSPSRYRPLRPWASYYSDMTVSNVRITRLDLNRLP